MEPIMERIQQSAIEWLTLSQETPISINIDDKSATIQLFDVRTSSLLYRYYFLNTLMSYIRIGQDKTILIKEVTETIEQSPLSSTLELEAAATGEITEIEIVKGEKEKLEDEIALLISNFIHILSKSKDTINFSYDKVMERVRRSKEKEKDQMTDFLQNMTDEERDVENTHKNLKLGKWGAGLQKGLTQYVQEVYDQEREVNYDIDKIAGDVGGDEIEKHELDMTNQHEDDDFGDGVDGDEEY